MQRAKVIAKQPPMPPADEAAAGSSIGFGQRLAEGVQVWGRRFLFFVAMLLALATFALLVGGGLFVVYPAFEMVTGDTIFGKSMGFPAFGQFGDSFGVVTAVATTGALVMLFFSYLQQQSEFKHMRRVMARQAIGDAIFNMCKLYTDILEQMVAYIPDAEAEMFEFGGQDKPVRGRKGLGDVVWNIASTFSMRICDEDDKRADYEKLRHIAGEQFAPYEGCFRILHNIFRYIYEREELSNNDKMNYARMVRAMLSNTELEALMINCLTERGKKMRFYAEQYAILHNLPPDGVRLPPYINEMLRSEYSPSAFKDGRTE